MNSKKVLAIGGDGIGPEVVGATVFVLVGANFNLTITKPPEPPPDEPYNEKELKQLCDESDAILFGAGGAAAPGRPRRGSIGGYLRFGLDNFMNIRPAKSYPGACSSLKEPDGIDLVVLRELSEGLYSFMEGDIESLQQALPDTRNRWGKSFGDFGKGKYAIRVISERGCKRLAEAACKYTLWRKSKGHPGKLTCVHKSNVLTQTCGLFEATMQEEVKKYPELTYEKYHIDDMARRLVRYPREFDVIVTSNLFGDVISEEAAELVGGVGMGGSACVGGRVPYFESIHGSAPKYTGLNVMNPTATLLAAKMMLEHFEMDEEAAALEKAIADVFREGKTLTRDQGGTATTTEFAQAVLRRIK